MCALECRPSPSSHPLASSLCRYHDAAVHVHLWHFTLSRANSDVLTLGNPMGVNLSCSISCASSLRICNVSLSLVDQDSVVYMVISSLNSVVCVWVCTGRLSPFSCLFKVTRVPTHLVLIVLVKLPFLIRTPPADPSISSPNKPYFMDLA